jgi:AraC-like DNA-binding protein
MREAVAILSNPDDDTPLKVLYQNLGYNTMSVFYTSFSKETGVPPSKYRTEIRRMHHANTKTGE